MVHTVVDRVEFGMMMFGVPTVLEGVVVTTEIGNDDV